MAIKKRDGTPLLLERPNPLVEQHSSPWDHETLSFFNWKNFGPEFIQEQPKILPPPIPKFGETFEDDGDDFIPEFKPVNSSENEDDDDLYSGDFDKVAESVGIGEKSLEEGRTPKEGFDPYDPKFDHLHFNLNEKG